MEIIAEELKANT
ncbi:unnamed protein product, partial [Rotaria sp. Silwood1]